MPHDLGAAIRAARQAKDWTQDQLAQAAGLSTITIKTLEGNRYTPRGETLHRLAQALDTSMDALMGYTDRLAGPLPVSQLQAWGLTDAQITRYERLWPRLSRKRRAWLLGHLELMARAERTIRALEEGSESDSEPPDDQAEPVNRNGNK